MYMCIKYRYLYTALAGMLVCISVWPLNQKTTSWSLWRSYTDTWSSWTNILAVWVLSHYQYVPSEELSFRNVCKVCFHLCQVCELDIIFNFEKVSSRPLTSERWSISITGSVYNIPSPSLSSSLPLSPIPQAYFILDELVVGGEIQETSKKNIVRAITAQDMLQEVSLD